MLIKKNTNRLLLASDHVNVIELSQLYCKYSLVKFMLVDVLYSRTIFATF